MVINEHLRSQESSVEISHVYGSAFCHFQFFRISQNSDDVSSLSNDRWRSSEEQKCETSAHFAKSRREQKQNGGTTSDAIEECVEEIETRMVFSSSDRFVKCLLFNSFFLFFEFHIFREL